MGCNGGRSSGAVLYEDWVFEKGLLLDAGGGGGRELSGLIEGDYGDVWANQRRRRLRRTPSRAKAVLSAWRTRAIYTQRGSSMPSMIHPHNGVAQANCQNPLKTPEIKAQITAPGVGNPISVSDQWPNAYFIPLTVETAGGWRRGVTNLRRMPKAAGNRGVKGGNWIERGRME